MPEDAGRINFSDLSPEFSRPFRGLRVWLPMKLHGVGAFRDHLEEKLELARLVLDELQTIPGIEIVAKPQLSILAFRLKLEGMNLETLNELNRSFLERLNAPQRIYLTSTMLGGRFVLRIALLSFRTHRDRILMGLEDIRAAAAEILGSVQGP